MKIKYFISFLLILPIFASINSCNKDITYNVNFNGNNCRVKGNSSASFDIRIKAGEVAKFKFEVTNPTRFTLPKKIEVKLADKIINDYEYYPDTSRDYNFSIVVTNNIKITVIAANI